VAAASTQLIQQTVLHVTVTTSNTFMRMFCQTFAIKKTSQIFEKERTRVEVRNWLLRMK